jgi:hypothetical protein
LEEKDPFVGWLQENISYEVGEELGRRTMGETYFYVDKEEIQK